MAKPVFITGGDANCHDVYFEYTADNAMIRFISKRILSIAQVPRLCNL